MLDDAAHTAVQERNLRKIAKANTGFWPSQLRKALELVDTKQEQLNALLAAVDRVNTFRGQIVHQPPAGPSEHGCCGFCDAGTEMDAAAEKARA